MNAFRIEEMSLNHWPALSTTFYDGWIVRISDGYTKRANSISPIYPSTYDLNSKIADCEQRYAEHHLPVCYKITPFVQPADLDDTLAGLGYASLDLTSVQTRSLAHLRKPDLHSAVIHEEVSDDWLANFEYISGLSAYNLNVMKRMLSSIQAKKALISLYAEDRVVSCGLGVLEQEYIGLYDIVTDADYRNRGYGEQMILHLLQWGVQQGAKYSYLAVVANNRPALRLYEKLGYAEIYKYWYRIRKVKV